MNYGSFQSLFPPRDFDFPIVAMETAHVISSTLDGEDYCDVKYLSSGSNAVVFTASKKDAPNKTVVIKMLKPKVSHPKVAEQEMNLEMQILTKANHPNIIGIHGAGDAPRKFIAIDYLGGGTLEDLIRRYQGSSGIPLKMALPIALELASALKYLHDDMHPDAIVIHRGTNISSQFYSFN